MATLNSLADQVAGNFDRNTDFIFIERVKDLIISTRNQFMHRQLDKYGIDDRYIQPYLADLQLMNASLDSNIPSRFSLLRTINKIPTPIRYNTDAPFPFVGSLDRMISYRNIKPYIMKNSRNVPLIGNGICYFYTNGYVYIWNNTKLERVLIEAIYEKLDVTTNITDTTGLCYTDDMEFPLSGNMLNDVIKEVINILSNTPEVNQINPVTLRDIN